MLYPRDILTIFLHKMNKLKKMRPPTVIKRRSKLKSRG
jgi:hypothetical protein